MSNLQTDIFLETMWDTHKDEYLKWCNDNDWQADGADFWLWLEERDLIPGDIYEAE